MPTDTDPYTRGLGAYVAFWEGLHTGNAHDLESVTTPNVRFCDPFNDVTGQPALRRILDHMFATTDAPRFDVLDQGLIGGGAAVLRWRFTARIPVLGALDVTGMSLLRLDEAGRVREHVDYWDTGPAIWMRLPVIGAMLRRLARRFQAPQ